MKQPNDMIIAAARSWVGTPYRHQASLKGLGCDCLGLIRGIWREVYGREPEDAPAYTPDWAERLGRETLVEAAARHMKAISPTERNSGDLLLFRWRMGYPAKHAAILTAPRHMIHAHQSAAVCEVPISAWWHRRLSHVFRFPDLDGPGAAKGV